MRPGSWEVSRATRALTLLGLAFGLGCTDQTGTSPNGSIDAAAAGSGGSITVRSTVPSSSPRDTTVDILVRGTGFDQGSRATWALKGDSTYQTTKIHTNSTTFVNSTALIANITIGADAQLALYDLQVLSAGGKKGIGIEAGIFEVTIQVTALPMLDGAAASPVAINDAGVAIGAALDAKDRVYAVRWQRIRGIWNVEKLTGGSDAIATEINNRGTIVGYRISTGHVVLWTLAGRTVELGPGIPSDLSEQETVVGSQRNDNVPGWMKAEAVLWKQTSSSSWSNATVLPKFAGEQGSQAYAISASGTHILGHAYDADAVELPVRWDLVGGNWQGPRILPNNLWSAAFDINNNGDAVGSGLPLGCDPRVPPYCSAQAKFWSSNGTFTQLSVPGLTGSHAPRINNAGQAIGFAWTEDRQFAFRWSPRTGKFEDLGTLLGDSWYEAADINSQGQVVGHTSSFTSGFLERPLLWTVR
jgi:probable HAF family extracellular repeat protein